MPYVFYNFYDYFLLSDYVTYSLEATQENVDLVKDLIGKIK